MYNIDFVDDETISYRGYTVIVDMLGNICVLFNVFNNGEHVCVCSTLKEALDAIDDIKV